MKTLSIAVAALAVLPAAGAMAGDDGHVPRGAWQPRDAAMQAAAGLGWHVEKIEADDGWGVRGSRSDPLDFELFPADALSCVIRPSKQ